MSDQRTFLAAAVQAEPIWFNLDATIEKTEKIVAETAKKGVQIVAFPEVWLPGYPVFVWMGDEAWQKPHRERYIAASLVLNTAHHRRLEEIARRHKVMLLLGFSERSGSKIYMSQMLINAGGATLMTRRKLKPSGLEATFFNSGGPDDLKVVETELGRIGALNCSEHRRPALRHAMYSLGEQLHIASWPNFGIRPKPEGVRALMERYDDWPRFGILPDVPSMQANACMTTTRAYAREGGLFVLAPTMIMGEAFILEFSDSTDIRSQLRYGGGSTRILNPFGEDAVSPFSEFEEGVLVAEVDYRMLRNVHDSDPFFEKVPLSQYQRRNMTA